MARVKFDPLESAKIGGDSEKPKASAVAFKDLDISDVEEATPPARPAPTTKAHPKYRVLVAGRVSIDGQVCPMAKDTVLDSAGYGGEAGIAKLLLQGLKLEMVQD